MPDRLTAAELQEIRERESKATKGPWQVHSETLPLSPLGVEKLRKTGLVVERTIHTTWNHGQLKGPAPVVSTSCGPYHEPNISVSISEADATFLAAARTDIPRLLATIDHLAAVIHEACEDIRECAPMATVMLPETKTALFQAEEEYHDR